MRLQPNYSLYTNFYWFCGTLLPLPRTIIVLLTDFFKNHFGIFGTVEYNRVEITTFYGEESMNCKKEPQECEAKLCCKATAQLSAEVESEIHAEDKSLSELLDDKVENEDQNTEK